MKTYMSEGQIRLVGRVWEIRKFLKLAQQHITSDVSLLEYLSKQTGHSHKKHVSPGFQFDREVTASCIPSSSSTLPQPQPQRPQKMRDPRVIPFPSK